MLDLVFSLVLLAVAAYYLLGTVSCAQELYATRPLEGHTQTRLDTWKLQSTVIALVAYLGIACLAFMATGIGRGGNPRLGWCIAIGIGQILYIGPLSFVITRRSSLLAREYDPNKLYKMIEQANPKVQPLAGQLLTLALELGYTRGFEQKAQSLVHKFLNDEDELAIASGLSARPIELTAQAYDIYLEIVAGFRARQGQPPPARYQVVAEQLLQASSC